MYFDKERVNKVLGFVKNLNHTKGRWAGVPFTLMDWQTTVISDIFGTVKDNGQRAYNMAYIELPKKMGKSELAAALALYGLCADGEWAAEVYGAAADRAQASIIFDVAVDMVEQNKTLKGKIKPILSQKRLVYLPTKSIYQVVSAEAYSKHGLNISMAIIDELHAQPKPDLFNVLTEGAGDARSQPLTLVVSTAGNDPDRESIGWQVHQTAQELLMGLKQDPTFYAYICGIDRDNNRIWQGKEYETVDNIDWNDESVWLKVNPSINHTIPLDRVHDHHKRAKDNPAKERNFRWLRLNSWERLKTEKWLGVDFWDLCRDKIDKDRLLGRVCYGGLDLSSKIDMTAFVLLFPPDDINKRWIVLPHFWLPEDNIARRVDNDRVPYDEWVRSGYLKTTPGNVIDYRFIEREIMDLAYQYEIAEIGYDPWNAMQTAISLEDEGLTMVEVRQGYKSMSPAMKEIEQLSLGRKILHNGDPILRWNVSNVEVKMDENENVRPVKGRNIERIDGLVALINAMCRCILRYDEESVYNERGIISL